MADPVASAPARDRWVHDVKNQLGIILGFSELLLQEMSDTGMRRGDIEEIHAAAQRALAALDQMPRTPSPDGGEAR